MSAIRQVGLSAAAGAILFAVTGCATPYRALKTRTGYFDHRITEDTFTVGFRGNAATREETVELYVFRRAAELTLQHGYKYFVVLDEKGRTRTGSIGYSGVKFPVVAPGSSCQIKCFHQRPEDWETVIDAAEFMRYNDFPEPTRE